MRPPPFLRKSLAARLALVYGLTSVVVVAVLGVSVYVLASHYLLDRARGDLAGLADFYVTYTATTAPDEARLTALAPQIVRFFAPQAGYEVRLFNAQNGSLLAATRDIGPLPSSAALAALDYRRPTLFLPGSRDLPERLYVAERVTGTGGSTLAVVEVSRDIGEIGSFLGLLRLVLAGAGGLALVTTLAASLIIARQMTHPLRKIESVSRAIAAGDFDERLEVRSDDEIGRLASSIRQMAADLARLEAARQEFIARISHDLRTPLTAIKGFVVNLQDTAPAEMQAALATMDEQTDRLIRLVNDLLMLSRLQRGEVRMRREETDLADLARSAVSLAREQASRLGVQLSLELPAGVPTVRGDADRLQRVVLNLLDNALKATRAGGTVGMQVAMDGNGVSVTVTDDGRGLTAEEAARAFEAYYRGPGGGAGLGLTIAREIVMAHAGRIWLRGRPEGGAEAGFWIPCSPAPGRTE
jgi:signal transduction histidine kinase